GGHRAQLRSVVRDIRCYARRDALSAAGPARADLVTARSSAALIQGSDGNLYGTTTAGGPSGYDGVCGEVALNGPQGVRRAALRASASAPRAAAPGGGSQSSRTPGRPGSPRPSALRSRGQAGAVGWRPAAARA